MHGLRHDRLPIVAKVAAHSVDSPTCVNGGGSMERSNTTHSNIGDLEGTLPDNQVGATRAGQEQTEQYARGILS